MKNSRFHDNYEELIKNRASGYLSDALEIKPFKGLKTVGHGGALGGYKSALYRFPKQNFSVIILSDL
jgi:hypothetical protein